MMARAAVSCMLSGKLRKTCTASSSNSLMHAFYHVAAFSFVRSSRQRSTPAGRDARAARCAAREPAAHTGGRPRHGCWKGSFLILYAPRDRPSDVFSGFTLRLYQEVRCALLHIMTTASHRTPTRRLIWEKDRPCALSSRTRAWRSSRVMNTWRKSRPSGRLELVAAPTEPEAPARNPGRLSLSVSRAVKNYSAAFRFRCCAASHRVCAKPGGDLYHRLLPPIHRR